MLGKAVVIVVMLSLLTYVIGLFSSRIVATEMLGPLQISYFGLFIVNNSDPLIEPLNNLIFSNGYNIRLPTPQSTLPNRIFSTGFTSSVITNLNIMLSLQILAPLLACLCYYIHKKSTSMRIKMERYWKLMLGELSLTFAIFNLYNFSCSFGAFLAYSSLSWLLYISIFEVLLFGGYFGFLIWMFVKKTDSYIGEYKTAFNWNVFSRIYYIIPIFERVAIGTVLVIGSGSFAAGIISILILIVSASVVGVKKPFA